MDSDPALDLYLPGFDCFYIRQSPMQLRQRVTSKLNIGGNYSSLYLYGSLDAELEAKICIRDRRRRVIRNQPYKPFKAKAEESIPALDHAGS